MSDEEWEEEPEGESLSVSHGCVTCEGVLRGSVFWFLLHLKDTVVSKRSL